MIEKKATFIKDFWYHQETKLDYHQNFEILLDISNHFFIRLDSIQVSVKVIKVIKVTKVIKATNSKNAKSAKSAKSTKSAKSAKSTKSATVNK